MPEIHEPQCEKRNKKPRWKRSAKHFLEGLGLGTEALEAV